GAIGGTVDGSVRLLAPAVGERSGVDGVVADRVEVGGHRGLGGVVVAGDGQGGAVRGTGRAGQRLQVLVIDVVEHLHHVRVRQVASGPSSAPRSWRVSGPRELLITTRCPAARLSRATVPPIIPLPMKPIVVMTPANPGSPQVIPRCHAEGRSAAVTASVTSA